MTVLKTSSRTLPVVLTGVMSVSGLGLNVNARSAHRVPAPPIHVLPLNEVEPPRDIEASRWKSPYCLAWDDGCTRCERASPSAKAACTPIAVSASTCVRSDIDCSRFEAKSLARVCQQDQQFHFSRKDFAGRHISIDAYAVLPGRSIGTDTYAWVFKKGRWDWDGQPEFYVSRTPEAVAFQAALGLDKTDSVRCFWPYRTVDFSETYKNARNGIKP